MSNKRRICTDCKIWWYLVGKTTECPKCNAHGFLTMNWNDIGTCIYFEQSDDNLSDYSEWTEKDSTV
jgi:hypothetical protein